ncbi:hypothetical protein EDB81DRAFT_845870 [Dactylonectria macrodidyma]|uniref:7alpha-cephem-methoxylase P8 chain n=1 Tax=Dactylonectria macrodidyma TaxID=307937 RepID=A0A9P9IQJ1_9HYPO|nr:hypothetical protein EDB81DRAFT_845870 [Dactylonectria macrodidyma]
MAYSTIPRGDITAGINFYLPPQNSAQPFDYVDQPPPGKPQRNYADIVQEVLIHDIHGHESDFTLDHDAFQILHGMPASTEEEFIDDDSIKKNYYPEIEKLLLDHVPGANHVLIFDHTVRRAAPNAHRSPVLYYPDEGDALLKQRYRLINVWRPLNQRPVESFPFAFASSSMLEASDFIPVVHHHQDGAKWYYLSGMTSDERVLLKCFDSESHKPDSDIGGRVPHTAFWDPRTKTDAEPRESIEVRTLVFGP